MCQGEIIDHSFPKVCPFTNDEFYKLVYDLDEEEIVPLYKNKKNEIHTLPKIVVEFDQLNIGYKKVKKIDDEDVAEFEIGTYLIDKQKKVLTKNLKEILKKLEKGTKEYDFLKILIEGIENIEYED